MTQKTMTVVFLPFVPLVASIAGTEPTACDVLLIAFSGAALIAGCLISPMIHRIRVR